MGKRVAQGTLPQGPAASLLEAGTVGRFTLLHDPSRPPLASLALDAPRGHAAWSLPRGLPTRPGEPRPAAPAAEPAGEPWDEGRYRSEGARGLMLEGRRVRGRYALRAAPDGWLVERLDEAWVPMPARVLPMLASPSDYPRDEESYAFEPKWDGIRALAYVEGGRATLRTRNLVDVTGQYPELARLGERLKGHDALLDGEIVAFDERGLPSFQLLQARLGVTTPRVAHARASDVPVVYLVFDVLWHDGRDAMRLPYEERRRILESLPLGGDVVRLSPSVVGSGRALLATPGLEGVVAKRLGSLYEKGARSRAWLKIKEQRRQEFVIAGWTTGRGARRGRIGALLLGVRDEPGGALRYAGSVGTGFTDRMLDDLERSLLPDVRVQSPFAAPIDKKDAVFVEPRLVCEVEFTEWTRDGRLRHPSFKGLRDDKDPADVVREER
jgi:bifunctional non-homologous end joining protein LigD